MLLRELAIETGLAAGVTGALLDTYRGSPVHLPGQVFTDLAVAIADGADAVTRSRCCATGKRCSAPVASMPTAWRLLDRIDAAAPGAGAGGAGGGAGAGVAGRGGPGCRGELRIDFDATISIAHQREAERGGHLEEDVRLPPGAP